MLILVCSNIEIYVTELSLAWRLWNQPDITAEFRVCISLSLWLESIAGCNAVKALNHCLCGAFDCSAFAVYLGRFF
jgi:hypothetical protein